MTKYTDEYVSELVQKYESLDGGYLHLIKQGGLLKYRFIILTADDKKSVVITEKHLNEWSSAYTITEYDELPQKYEDMLHEWIYCENCDDKYPPEKGFGAPTQNAGGGDIWGVARVLEGKYKWSEKDIRGFLGENLMRVYKENWK